jgi:proline dehydrogenase
MDGSVDHEGAALRFRMGLSQQLSRDCGIDVRCRSIRMGTTESTIQSLIRRAASAYTAGPAINDARQVCERLAGEGIASTVCYWDVYADQPRFISQSYIDLLGVISGLKSDCYLSVKAPALKFDLDLLKRILAEAARINAIVHFDAMSPDTVDRTFALIEDVRPLYPKLGCTLPGRWRRSQLDADRAIDLGLRVRVVKGEWAGADSDEMDTRLGYLDVIDRLAAGRAMHVAVATHNPELARKALSRLKTSGTRCDLELLYGLPQGPLIQIARDAGVPVRMYVPYGKAGLPYRLKDSVRNPRYIGWFLHDLFRGH